MGTRTAARAIDALRRDLANADDFTALMDRFFDCVEADPELTRAAEGHRSPRLEDLVSRIAGELFDRSMLVLRFQLLRVPRYRLVHGSVVIAGRLATVVWFEEPRQGLLAIAMGGSQMHYVRFTEAGTVPPPADPAAN